MKTDVTNREKEVIRLKSIGLSSKEIAERLQTSVTTVTSHMEHIYRKLGIHNEVELTRWHLHHQNQTS